LALGFEQAGFDVVAAVEIDPIHSVIHKHNFPECVVICQDVKTVTGDLIRERAKIGRASIDVVIGGPPCQGFSLIGHRVLDDPRNSLVMHFLRIVRELRPKAFVLENVPGMATGKHHQLLTELIAGFAEADYKVRAPYKILNAADYGVPQDRRRLFLLGSRKDVRLPDYPEPTFNRPANSKGKKVVFNSLLTSGPTVLEAIQDVPDIDLFEELFESDVLNAPLLAASPYARQLRGELMDPTDFSYPRSVEEAGLTGCRRADHSDLSRSRFASTPVGTVEPVSRFLRLPPDGLCNTLRAGTASDRGAFTSPRPIHPLYARCISVREAARLHSYPDWFRFHRTIWHGFRQIGNSVPPRLGRAVGASVLSALGATPERPTEVVSVGPSSLVQMNMKDAASHLGVRHDVIAQRTRSVSA
jgi:DNA (cytosine-5)-methyltransferase 1